MLATVLYDMDHHPWKYKAIIEQDRRDSKIQFQAPPHTAVSAVSNQVEAESNFAKDIEEEQRFYPVFGPTLNIKF